MNVHKTLGLFGLFGAWTILLLTACSDPHTPRRDPRPSDAQVQRVEIALAQQVGMTGIQCGMSMSKAHRYYHFKRLRFDDPIDTNVISVVMLQGDTIPPGVTVEGPSDFSQPDDVQAAYFKGEYSLTTGKLTSIWCGPNQEPFKTTS